MAGFRTFLKSGHAPTLGAAFFYFAFSCCIWVMNGAMAPFISESYNLSPAQKGVMLSIPIFAGALMRFPLGVLAQYIGRKNATLVEMAMIMVALLFGYFLVDSYNSLLAMGVLLGIAGASFGVALSLGSGSFPAALQGAGHGPGRRRQRRDGGVRAGRPGRWPSATAGRPSTASRRSRCCCPWAP